MNKYAKKCIKYKKNAKKCNKYEIINTRCAKYAKIMQKISKKYPKNIMIESVTCSADFDRAPH